MRVRVREWCVVLLFVIPVAVGGSPAALAQSEKFLGYEIGEERRYVLGPEESLLRGEMGFWSIRLEEVFRSGDGLPEGLFALQHQWQAPQLAVGTPPLRAIMRVQSEGTVRINRYGFPLMMRFETRRHLAGMGEQAYTIDYEIEDENRRYQKRTTMDGDRWYQTVGIRKHDTIERESGVGLFAFLPTAPGCLDREVITYNGQGSSMPQPRSAGSQPGAQMTPPSTVKVVNNADCEEALFANPGLLALGMPMLWEAQGEREYVFFTPIGPMREQTNIGIGYPRQPYGPGAVTRQPGMGGSGMGAPSSMGRLEGDPLSAGNYHEIETLKFIERVSVRVGSRTREAWLIEMSDDAGPIYVDDDGGVLRIDLPPLPDAPERFIRMLWPSEF